VDLEVEVEMGWKGDEQRDWDWVWQKGEDEG
jgi:hypothetical protein